ncbi:MAG: class I SAM-dependent methyltransferase [Candidatus Eisenbacteria bacterium]
MDWVKPHYTRQSELVGSAEIRPSHERIARLLHDFISGNGGARRLLELGAGACGLAAALTRHGYEVVAVEFNPRDIELAHELVRSHGIRGLEVVEGDFYEVELEGRFDVIYYWDGFGVGEDSDQRRLLRRIGTEWLAEDGYALIDVFSPWNWLARTGSSYEFQANDGSTWTRRIEFDAVNSRFVDFLRPLDGRPVELSQTIRTYSVPEFRMLVEGTGTRAEAIFDPFGEDAIAVGHYDAETSGRVAASNGFVAKLVREP